MCLPLRFWQGQKDSNPRHVVLETTALPTELCPYEDDIGLSELLCSAGLYPAAIDGAAST